MLAYLATVRPYPDWKLQGLELAAHAFEAAILLVAMAIMQVCGEGTAFSSHFLYIYTSGI